MTKNTLKTDSLIFQIPMKAFYILMFLFPCLYAFFVSSATLSGFKGVELLTAAVYVISVFYMIFALFFGKENSRFLNSKHILTAIIIVGVLLRLALIISFRNRPVSDFEIAHDTARELALDGISIFNPRDTIALKDDEIVRYYACYPSWALYMIMLKNCYLIFEDSFFVGQILNVVLSALIMIVLYFIGKNYTNSKAVGLAAATLFAFWPNAMMYTMILTPDYFTILFSGLVILYFGYLHKKINQQGFKKTTILHILLFGVVLGILNRFKSIALIFVVALFIYIMVYYILPGIAGKIKDKTVPLLNLTLKCIASFCMILVSFSFTVAGIDLAIEANIGAKPSNLTGWFTYVGLTDNGMWSQEKADVKEYLLQKYDYDLKATSNQLLETGIANATKDINKTIELIKSKTKMVWENDLDIYWCDNGSNMKHTFGFINATARLYYVGLLFLVLLGIAKLIKKSDNATMFITALYMFGFSLILLFSEVQSRYRLIIAAPMVLLAAYAMKDKIGLKISFKKRTLGK